MAKTVLHLDSSSRGDHSFTRKFSESVVQKLKPSKVIYRDLALGVPIIDADWAAARFTPKDKLTSEQKDVLAFSDELIAEIKAADVIVIGSPIYNFNISAPLKLWIDQIARPGETFYYNDEGQSIGMLGDKEVIITIASAGVTPDTPVDFVTDYLKFFFGFIGVTNLKFIWGDRAMFRGDEVFEAVGKQIDEIV